MKLKAEHMLFVTVVATPLDVPGLSSVQVFDVHAIETHRKGFQNFHKLAAFMRSLNLPWTVYAFNESTKQGFAWDQFRRPLNSEKYLRPQHAAFPRRVTISSLKRLLAA